MMIALQWRKLLIVCASQAVLAVPVFSSTQAGEGFKAPFDVSAQRRIFGHAVGPLAACPAPPTPIRDHKFEVFYSDSAQSVRDEGKFQAQLDRAKGLRDYSSSLSRMADDYVASRAPDHARAACVLSWLDAWAKGGALLGNVDKWARFDTLWFVHVAASLAYLKIRDDPALDPGQRQRVITWLARVAQAGVDNWQNVWGTRPSAPPNNHAYWAGASAVLGGVVAGDRRLFDFGVAAARRGLDSVTADGALPGELKREGRAFYYHIWALEPLTLIVATAQANGVNLLKENNRALERIVDLMVRAHSDGALFQRLAGVKQTDDSTQWPKGGYQIGFGEPFLHMRDNPQLDRLVAGVRPVNVPYIAGDYTLLFAKARR